MWIECRIAHNDQLKQMMICESELKPSPADNYI